MLEVCFTRIRSTIRLNFTLCRYHAWPQNFKLESVHPLLSVAANIIVSVLNSNVSLNEFDIVACTENQRYLIFADAYVLIF